MSTETTVAATDTTNAATITPAVTAEASAPVIPATPTESPAPAAAVVPEKYDLKLSDGSLLEPGYLEQFEAFAKEKKLSSEMAKELLSKQDEVVKSYYDKEVQKFENTKEAWKQQAMKDPEIGGDSFPKNVELAHRALEKFSTPEFIQALDSTGYGNHPELVRVFARIGKLISEDTMKMPGTNSGGQKSYEDIFYGSNKP